MKEKVKKIVACKCCGKLFEKNKTEKYCSEECREEMKKRRSIEQGEKQRAERAEKKAAQKREKEEKEAYRSTDKVLFNDRALRAKVEGTTYGQLQAEAYKKTVKIDRPRKTVPREYREQQFREIVEQNLVSNY